MIDDELNKNCLPFYFLMAHLKYNHQHSSRSIDVYQEKKTCICAIEYITHKKKEEAKQRRKKKSLFVHQIRMYQKHIIYIKVFNKLLSA